MVPQQIDKAYLNDLTPVKGMIRFLLGQGLQPPRDKAPGRNAFD